MDAILYFFAIFFIVYLCVYMTFLLVSVVVGAFDLYHQKRRKKYYNYVSHDYYLPISVLVPAYNESVTVVSSIKSLLNLDYQLYEIVVVDDGSKDDTAQQIIDAFNLMKIERPIRRRINCKQEVAIYVSYDYKVPITLVIKENGGKADALNMGINVSEYPYFICVDADSLLAKDSLQNIIRPMLEEKDVVACGGIIRLSNEIIMKDGEVVDYKMPNNIVECMQVLEYDRSFLAARVLFDKFNGNLIISGAFGIFKKDTVIEAGGYKTGSIGEDMELVVRLHSYCRANRLSYKIRYVTDAICYSQAPANLKDLSVQRRRWHIGLFQSIFEHKHVLLRPQYGVMGTIPFIYYIIYELFSPIIEVFGMAVILYQLYFNIFDTFVILQFLLTYIAFCGLMSITAFASRVHLLNIKLKLSDLIRSVLLCLIENVFMRIYLLGVRLMALITYRSNKDRWGKIKRKTFNNEENSSN